MIKRPTLIPIGLISTITMTLILGYELQVRKIGLVVAESNGQAYHPIYVLAPIRLLTVIAGLFVAWVFTIFPYPVSSLMIRMLAGPRTQTGIVKTCTDSLIIAIRSPNTQSCARTRLNLSTYSRIIIRLSTKQSILDSKVVKKQTRT